MGCIIKGTDRQTAAPSVKFKGVGRCPTPLLFIHLKSISMIAKLLCILSRN